MLPMASSFLCGFFKIPLKKFDKLFSILFSDSSTKWVNFSPKIRTKSDVQKILLKSGNRVFEMQNNCEYILLLFGVGEPKSFNYQWLSRYQFKLTYISVMVQVVSKYRHYLSCAKDIDGTFLPQCPKQNYGKSR